jgi:hypothetical protein
MAKKKNFRKYYLEKTKKDLEELKKDLDFIEFLKILHTKQG